ETAGQHLRPRRHARRTHGTLHRHRQAHTVLHRAATTASPPMMPDDPSFPPATKLDLTYIRNGYTFRSMAKKNTAQAPLTPAVLHILLALSTGSGTGTGL